MKYIYGPLKSRRLGLSLGISLTPYKICSFDCIYCQLGATTARTSERKEYVNIEEISAELKSWFQNNPQEAKNLGFVTISGSGEPLLNIKIGQLISEIKKTTAVPVAIITNASLLGEQKARCDILLADLIIPSLDAATAEVFEDIDRPQAGIKIEGVIDGLISLRKEFRGKIWLEVMLVKGINDGLGHIARLKEAIDKINPDKIQLNSPVRATCEKGILPVDKGKLEKIIEILGEKCEVV
ncbi:MAG: radical SAM protein [Candidatus Omnitrophica bacterium]|nr:radical SAM protein [Candidatus Omnitrophota bacterium]